MKNKFLSLLFFSLGAQAYETQRSFQAHQVPHELKGIDIEEKLGQTVDLSLNFVNEDGKTVSLQQFFQDKPVLFTIIYYECPNLCQLHMNSLVSRAQEINLENDFEFVVLSMDSNESFELAQKKKQSYLKATGASGKNWHFLTGSRENINRISEQVGFNFHWNEKEKQFAHLPVAYVLTSLGKISRYLYGVEFSAKTLKLSLVESAQGRIGGTIERILLFCFRFDPRKNKYTLYAYNVMRAGGIFTVLLLIVLLVPTWLRARRLG